MKRFKKASIIFLMFMLLSVIAMPVSASAAKLNKKSISLNVGKTYTLKASGTKGKITWTSSKKSVATVSSKGVVKAKKKGTAVITAKYGKKKLTCKVTVKQPVKTDPSLYFKTVELNAANVSQYFTYEIIDEYNMWGEHSGAGVYVKLKPSDWYLFYEEGLAIEYDFSIDCLNSDGNKVKYECNSGVTTEYSRPSGWGYKQSDRNSAVFKFGRAKGSLIFINKKAIKNMNFRYDNSIKRNRVYECTLSKDLDEYEFKGIKLKDMAEAGLSGTINHGCILQSFE